MARGHRAALNIALEIIAYPGDPRQQLSQLTAGQTRVDQRKSAIRPFPRLAKNCRRSLRSLPSIAFESRKMTESPLHSEKIL